MQIQNRTVLYISNVIAVLLSVFIMFIIVCIISYIIFLMPAYWV